MKNDDLAKLVIAVTKVEGAVNGLRNDFDKKSSEDLSRFEKLETGIEKHTATLATHAELHSSHARMIMKANELAIRAVEKAEEVRTEAQVALKFSLDTHAKETSEKLDGISLAADERKRTLDKIVRFQKHPLFKAAWFVGGLIGGAIAAYVAAH